MVTILEGVCIGIWVYPLQQVSKYLMIKVYFCVTLLWEKQSRDDVMLHGIEDLDSLHVIMLPSSNIAFTSWSKMAASTPSYTLTFQEEAEKRKVYSGYSQKSYTSLPFKFH